MSTSHPTMFVSLLLATCFMGVESTDISSENHLPMRVTSLSKCPTYLYYNSQSNDCECIPYHAVDCSEETATLLLGFCTTYEESTTLLSLSPCPYYVTTGYNMSEFDPGTILLPKNLSMLNDYMCTPMNRKGRVCSECIEGFGPAVMSPGYRIPCSRCTSTNWHVVPVYLLLEFGPVTVFYLIILVFQISMTTAPMTCFIMYSQLVVLVIDLIYDVVDYKIIKDIITLDEHSKLFLKVMLTILDFCNLRFFRYLLPSFCVSSRLKAIHVIFLEYVSAFYPFLLIFLTWCFVKLHDSNFRPFVCLWRPFHKCFVKLRRSWDAKSDIIDVFATVFLLSYTRLMLQTVYFVKYQRTESYSVTAVSNGSFIGFTTSYVTATDQLIPYGSSEHLTFAIPAVFIFLVFNILPTLLLLLYPVGMFRVCLSKCRLDGVALGIFVEKFYSCYRDGLDGGRDMRSFAAMYFFTRVFVVFTNVIAGLLMLSNDDIWFPSDIVLSVTAVLVATFRPYKKNYMNVMDTLLFVYLGLMSHLLSAHHGFHIHFVQTFETMILLPIVCFSLLVAWKAIQRVPKIHAFCTLCHCCRSIGRFHGRHTLAAESASPEQPLLSHAAHSGDNYIQNTTRAS